MKNVESVFTDHYKLLFRIVYAYVNDTEDTKDILQDTFIKAYRAAREELPPSNLLPWMIVIAKNTALTFLKKHKATEELDGREEAFSYEPDLLNFTVFNALEGILCTVPEDVRTPLKQNLLEDIPLKQLARESGMPFSTLRYWKNKLVNTMQEILGED